MRRTRLRSISEKRKAGRKEREAVRLQVFERDHWICQARHKIRGDMCFGDLTVHHLRKASAGGKYEVNNLIALCAHHNGWVEDHPIEAEKLGLVWR